MKLAIVGSTAFSGPGSRRIIEEAIRRHGATCIVSGGAKGIDSLAAQIAREMDLQVLEFKPDIQRWDDYDAIVSVLDGSTVVRHGFRSRNQQIADVCDALVRICWDPDEQRRVTGKKPSYGSGWTRDRAAEQGKPTEEHVLTLEQDASAG